MSGEMTSNRPFLLRALFEWISENGMTPHILVDAAIDGVDVPEQAVQKGKVILNIDQAAVQDLELGNEWLSFNARFSGRRYEVVVPVEAVLAIYAKENGQGMMFAHDEGNLPPTNTDPDPTSGDGDDKRSHLKLVK
jgi:stringent starvation protein B